MDDNANNREVALDFLGAARMQVDTAADGAEAVAMAKDGDYDLVLMDIQMQVLDGLSAAREIRALPGRAQLPIVAMTAHALSGDREKSLAARMNDHVVKPIDPDLLFRALLRWIDPARLQGRALPVRHDRSDAASQAAAPLPPLARVDWSQALASAGGEPAPWPASPASSNRHCTPAAASACRNWRRNSPSPSTPCCRDWPAPPARRRPHRRPQTTCRP